MLTLASINRRLAASPHLLKIDVEGTEWSVRADELARSGAEQLLLELHGHPASWLPLMEALVRDGGYLLWGVEQGRFYTGLNNASSSSSTRPQHSSASLASMLLPNADLIYANVYLVRPQTMPQTGTQPA